MIKIEGLTENAAAFVAKLKYEDLPDEALTIGRRCILDAMGQFAGGADTTPVCIVADDVFEQGGKPQALLLGCGDTKVPAALAARVLGTAGHAMDWDDTQATKDPRHTYGLLTHPTVPPLAAALCLAQAISPVSGRDLMTAFQAGFEVECKVAEWMLPDAYRRGLHASAAEGTIGAAVAAAKLLGLDVDGVRRAIGISTSLSSAGIRANVGTETKPLHFGRAAENGLIAALLARKGLECGEAPLDGKYGFLSVFGGGMFEDKQSQRFGEGLSIIDPGVSVKPYPSGILSHQAMDAMNRLVEREGIVPGEVAAIRFYAGTNILHPLPYLVAKDHLVAKFCMPALLSMIVLRRRAGKQEFTDEFVTSEPMRSMQEICEVHLDPDIEAQGFDKIRSRVEIVTKDGRTVNEWADERYRGSPEMPLTDLELEEKFRAATDGIMDARAQDKLISACWRIDGIDITDVGTVARLLPSERQQIHPS